MDDEVHSVNYLPLIRMHCRPEKVSSGQNRYRDPGLLAEKRLTRKNLCFSFHLLKEKAPAGLARTVAFKSYRSEVWRSNLVKS